MITTPEHNERIAKMTFASVYPHYVTKVEKKGRSIEELHQVIAWLTSFDESQQKAFIETKATFQEFFAAAKINPNATLIKGVICGYRIEDIENELTRQVRYLDKLVDELAKGKKMEKILRQAYPLPVMNAANTVEEYISQFPDAVKQILIEFRNIIQSNAPDATESISYGMPAYKLNKKPLVYFAAYSKHIGFYATPSGHEQFKTALACYKQGKGSVQFPLNETMPYDLIEEMVRFRIKENLSK